MVELLDVIQVTSRKDFTLLLTFENQEKRLFDMKPYLNKKPFDKIKELPLFLQAKIEYGTVVWPGDVDIAPETLYDKSISVK